MRLPLAYVGQYPDLIILNVNLVYLFNLVLLVVVGLNVPSEVVFID
jgi:hypothetical protein